MKTLKSVFLIGILLNFNCSVAQNVLRTEMIGKTVNLLNPALIGVKNNGQLNLMAGIVNFSPFKSNFSYAGYNTRINKISSGIGVYYFTKKEFNDINYVPQPTNGTTNFGFSYAFQHNITEKLTFSVGATASYYKYTEYWEEWINTINCSGCPTTNKEETAFDVNVGGLLYSKHFYFGASVFNVSNRTKKYIAPLNAKVNLGYTFISKADENIKLTIGTMAEHDGDFLNLQLNTLLKYKYVYAGVSLKMLTFQIVDYTSFQFGVEYDRFRINYNVSINNYNIYDEKNSLTQEIGLQIKLPKTLTSQSNKFEHILF